MSCHGVVCLARRPVLLRGVCGASQVCVRMRAPRVRVACAPSLAHARVRAGNGFASSVQVAKSVVGAALRCVTMRVVVCALVLASVGALRLSPAGGALDALVGVFENAPVEALEPRRDVEATGSFMQRLGAQPAPASRIVGRALDPERHHSFALCERDFGQPCPGQFVSVGAGECAPGSDYRGPCNGDARGLGGLSPAAKERWSGMCLAWWPCTECQRDFSELCPRGWAVGAGAGCKPTAAYTGPCAAPVDFTGYSRDMLGQWSSSCGAHWPCAGTAGGSGA